MFLPARTESDINYESPLRFSEFGLSQFSTLAIATFSQTSLITVLEKGRTFELPKAQPDSI